MKTRNVTGSSWPQIAADSHSIGTKGHGAKTEAVRERAIAALLSERTIGRAAKLAGTAERTLRRWLAEDSAFKAAFASARQATFQNALDRIQVATAQAVNTLEDLLSEKKHPAVRLGAARTIVELGLHRHDADTIMRKLHEIEAVQRDEQFGRSGRRGR